MSTPIIAEPLSLRWLRPYTKLMVVATIVLIFLGGQVKSHEAGLAVPDWPTSFGVNMFLFHWSNWIGGVFYEHVHRLAASTVGLMSLVLAAWLALAEPRKWVKVLGFVALGAVILQGVLGGLTVIFLLPAPVSTAHAVLAQSFLMLTVLIAYSQSVERRERPVEHTDAAKSMLKPAAVLTGLVFAQLILGAFMRHTESGLAIPDFPTMGGQWLPWFSADTMAWINQWRSDYAFEHGTTLEPVSLGQVWIHFSHRLGAIAIVAVACVLTVVAYRRRETDEGAWETVYFLDMLIIVQASLGVFTVLTQRVPIVASVHVAAGAATLALCTLLLLRVAPLRVTARAAASQPQRIATLSGKVSTSHS